MTEAPWCFDCWPGGPVVPPPCLRCGSTQHYFTNGLCGRCHPFGPQRVDSCQDCWAWGATRHTGWRCIACDRWRQIRELGTCRSCGRPDLPLNHHGACRLCTKQRTRVLATRPWPIPDLLEANRHGQQLFFADMIRLKGSHPPRRRPPATTPVIAICPVAHRQLVLFDWPRDLRAGRRHGFRPPPDPRLAAALDQRVNEHAARHGWKPGHTQSVSRGVRILLGVQDTPGAPIRYSEARLLAQLDLSVPAVTAVLAEAGMLDDDREPAIVGWFDAQVAELPVDMRAELAVWFDVMRHGSPTPPRRLPRADATTGNQLRSSLPALKTWARTHDSLREIAREDVYSVLPPSGDRRALMLQGLRSIFRVLKGRNMVFVNPTARMRAPAQQLPAPRPVDIAGLRAALDSDDPARAALAALLGFHAVRVTALRNLRLTDVRDGRLHIDDTVILLAEPVRDRLSVYLDHRARCWPDTINPHLFINRRSATHTGQVNANWVAKTLGMPAQTIRRDRILDEAFATGGDLRQISDMFGVSVATAHRFANYVHSGQATEPHRD
jgi:hypothetical protein